MQGNNNLTIIRNFLDDNFGLLAFRDESRNTLMHIACLANRSDVVAILCEENSAYKDAKNIFGQTPAFLAVWNGSMECLPMLLSGDVNNVTQFRDEFENTLLHIACLVNRDDALKMLCEKNMIDIHARNKFDQTPTT